MRTSVSGLAFAILFLAAAWGFWAVVAALAVFGLALAVVAYQNAKFFDRAHDRYLERCRRDAEAELSKALKEIGRVRAHAERTRLEQNLWGRN
jgi:hypothetical protein